MNVNCKVDGVTFYNKISFSFLSERETADKNYALGYLMNANKVNPLIAHFQFHFQHQTIIVHNNYN